MGIEIFPYFLSPVIIVLTILIIFLRKRKVIHHLAFVYVLSGVSNVYIGILGVYFNLTSQQRIISSIDLLFVVNILCAGFIFGNIFRTQK